MQTTRYKPSLNLCSSSPYKTLDQLELRIKIALNEAWPLMGFPAHSRNRSNTLIESEIVS